MNVSLIYAVAQYKCIPIFFTSFVMFLSFNKQ